MDSTARKEQLSSSSSHAGPITRAGKRSIAQISSTLPSSQKSRRTKEVEDSKAILDFIDKTAEEALRYADSLRSKRSVEDYSYVIKYHADNSVENVTLPSDFNTRTNDIDRLIAFLIKTCELFVTVENPKVPKQEEEIPDVLSKYISGIITAFASETKLPTVWKEKDQPMEIAKQAILWKRFEGWFVHNDVKPTHQFRFCHPTISGSGEKTSFNKFYTLLSKQSGEHSGQRAKLVKTLIQLACTGHAVRDISNVLDAHRISKAEISRDAKPQAEDKTKRRRKDAPKTFVTKILWDPVTFPFLTQCEKEYLNALKAEHTGKIKTFTAAWERLPAVEQYVQYKPELLKLKDLYQKYYQEVDRASTRLHRRRMLFESYLRNNKIAEPKGPKLLKSTVAHFETQKAKPLKEVEFAFVMDPRNVLLPAGHGRFTNPNDAVGDDSQIWEKTAAVCNEFYTKYPDYSTKHYTDNVLICKTTNVFKNLSVREDEEMDEDSSIE